jgi:Flp pilus assembly protein TadD
VDARKGLASLYLRSGDTSRAEETLRKATDDLADDAAAAPLLSAFYQQTGQMGRAQAAYEDLVRRHPNSLALQLAYIRVLMDQGSYDKARPLIQELAQKHETDPGVDLLQAHVLMHDGQNNAAVDVLQAAAKNEPDNLDIAILLGKAQQQSGDLRQAGETFHNALQLNPRSLDALRGIADVAFRKGDLSGLREAARLILLQYPQLADGYLWRGIANLRDHQNAPAIADLEEALRRDPNNGLTMVQLGLAKAATGDSAKARLLFEQVLKSAPDAAALGALTQMDVQSGQTAAAIARIQQQIQRAPASSDLYDQLAQAQLAAKDPASAAASVKHALELDHSNRSAMQTFTQIELSTGELGLAVDLWQRWASDHPADPQAPSTLGMLYESAGDEKLAAEFYRKSLAIEPDQPNISARQAALLAASGGNSDVALSMAQAAYRARPASADTADALGWIYLRKGLAASALGPLQAAVNADPTDATIQYHLGVVQARLGNKPEAINHLTRAQTMSVGTDIAAKAQQELAKLR